MKLEKFNNKKKIIIKSFIFVVVSIIGMVIFRSYVLYKNEKETNIANEDVKIAFTINGEKSKEAFPSKTSGYEVNSVTCKNGVTASWNQEKWGLSNIESNGTQKIQCNIDFSKALLVNYLKNLNSSELVDDETTDHNLRYIGANPNNYVSFNGELWRIIGLMKNIENPDKTKLDKVKIIRQDVVAGIARDNTGECGNNDWNESALRKVLNQGAYYNRTSGICPSGANGGTSVCDFSENGLTKEAKEMISESIWTTGISYATELARDVYKLEKNETITQSVGLMYASDYGYATAGGAKTNRTTCLNTNLNEWENMSDCFTNNWIFRSDVTEWTMLSGPIGSCALPHRRYSGIIYLGLSINTYGVRPVVYLDTNLKIKNGTGTSTDPFVLEY